MRSPPRTTATLEGWTSRRGRRRHSAAAGLKAPWLMPAVCLPRARACLQQGHVVQGSLAAPGVCGSAHPMLPLCIRASHRTSPVVWPSAQQQSPTSPPDPTSKPHPLLQIQELREAIVLPITHRDRFVKLGIKPPKGVLLHGPPGGRARLGRRARVAESKMQARVALALEAWLPSQLCGIGSWPLFQHISCTGLGGIAQLLVQLESQSQSLNACTCGTTTPPPSSGPLIFGTPCRHGQDADSSCLRRADQRHFPQACGDQPGAGTWGAGPGRRASPKAGLMPDSDCAA